MPEVVVVGSINMDLVIKTARLPKAGETIKGETFRIIPGGKGANQAVAARNMGVKSALVGCVGRDVFGRELLQALKEQAVDVQCVEEMPGASTGIASITVDENGENRIIVVAGANGKVRLEQISSSAHLISTARIVILQNEIPMETNERVIEIAHENGVQVLWNPAPACAIPAPLLPLVDIFVLNEVEAAFLTGREVKGIPSALKAAEKLHDKGAKRVIVTLGDQGAVLFSKNHELQIPAIPVEVVDTTAAGDSFVGGLAAALVREEPIEYALRYAVCAGCLAVTKEGAQPSIPSHAAVIKTLSDLNHRGSKRR